MSQEEYTQENVIIIRESEAATLIEVDDEEYWIPHSQIKKTKRHPDGQIDIVMTAWIAKQKGLI